MKCFANNSKGSRCQKKGDWKKFGFCDHHNILKSDWFFLERQVFKLPIGLIIVSIAFVFTTITAWEIEEYWSIKRKSNSVRDSASDNVKSTIFEEDFHVVILPFGSSDYCEGEKILCERELKKLFTRVVGRDSLSPVKITVRESQSDIESVLSVEELLDVGKRYNADLLIWGDYTRRCSWDSTKVLINYAIFDDFLAQYGGIQNRVNSIEGEIGSISELSNGNIVGGIKDVVYWSLGVREALVKRNYKRGIELLKEVDASPKKEFSRYFHLLAFCYQNTYHPQKAIQYYSLVTEVDSTDFWPYNNRGALYMSMGEIDLALNDFLKGIEISNGTNPNLYVNLSILLFQFGKIETSIEALDKALMINPEFLDGLVNRAKMYAFLGDKEKGLIDLQSALKIRESPLVLLEFAQYHLSEKAYEKSLRYVEKAVDKYEKPEGDPYNYDTNAIAKILIIKIKILEATNPTSREIDLLKERLKPLILMDSPKGAAIPGFGEYLFVSFENTVTNNS